MEHQIDQELIDIFSIMLTMYPQSAWCRCTINQHDDDAITPRLHTIPPCLCPSHKTAFLLHTQPQI